MNVKLDMNIIHKPYSLEAIKKYQKNIHFDCIKSWYKLYKRMVCFFLFWTLFAVWKILFEITDLNYSIVGVGLFYIICGNYFLPSMIKIHTEDELIYYCIISVVIGSFAKFGYFNVIPIIICFSFITTMYIQ